MLPGTVLGHYRIISPLGKGGMGEVYAAEDTKLHRTVALKILPPSVAADPERRKRFEREAQAVAALNHPNIVTIYSVEEAGGVVFLAMEAVDGRTLKETLESGPIPIDAMLRIAIAVSDAMAAAHQRGITHRDLKPANVMVTPDGRVKVLDFGLAKVRDVDREGVGELPTRLKGDDLTGEGHIIGTVAYMSPEQAEGKSVDPRSDVFSFGVMLHEMAAGERPFKGDTDISVISSILKETPRSITDIKPDLPADLARIVRRCLSKDPTRRYQIATDLRNDLEDLKQDLDSGKGPAPVTPPAARRATVFGRGRNAWIAAGGLVILAAAAGLFFWLTRNPPPPATFNVERVTRLTENGTAGLAALSRDGRYVVHVKTEGGLQSLWVRQTATTSDMQLVPPALVDYDGLTFSPDGVYVYYVSYLQAGGPGSLYRIPTLSGAPTRVLEDVDSGIAFSHDGHSFAFARGTSGGIVQVVIAAADGSGARIVASLDKERMGIEAPAWSPDGRTILMTLRKGPRNSEILAVDVGTGAVNRVGETWAALKDVAWMPDGRSFITDGTDSEDMLTSQLWQVMYPSGERRRVTNDLDGYKSVSLSEDGTTVATVQSTRQSGIWVLAPGASEAKEMDLRAGRGPGQGGLDWTLDGRLVFTAQVGGRRHIWIAAADGSGARQLTSGEHGDAFPRVSPDGRWIYYAFIGKPIRLARIGIDGSDQRTLTGIFRAPAFSADGRWMYFNAQNRLMRMPTDGGDAAPVGDQPFAMLDVSPDGTTLLGVTFNAEKVRSECATMPADGGAPRLLGEVGPTGADIVPSCRWDPSGTAITYVAFRDGQFNMFMRPLAGGEERQLTHFRDGLQVFSAARAHDGRIALSRGSTMSDVVLISSAR